MRSTGAGRHLRRWALRSRLQIPLAHITNVEINTDQVGDGGMASRSIGTDVPGLLGAPSRARSDFRSEDDFVIRRRRTEHAEHICNP